MGPGREPRFVSVLARGGRRTFRRPSPARLKGVRMTRQSTWVVAAALMAFVYPIQPAHAQQTSPLPQATTLLASAHPGAIQGVVLGQDGRPLSGAMVSALGSTVAFALTGRDGRFNLDALPLGTYTVRVHLDGFVPSRRQMVEVRGQRPSVVAVAMLPQAAPAAAKRTTVMLAGLSPFDAVPVSLGASRSDGRAKDDEAADHDHSEAAWRLRHLKRSVLKTVETPVALDPADEPADEGSALGRSFASAVRFSSGPLADSPLTGQIDFVTTGSLDGEQGVGTPNALPAASVAYAVLGASLGQWAEWDVRGAVRQGELGSWFLAGTFSGRAAGSHRFTGGLAYGTQRLERGNLMGRAAIQSGSRAVGAVYGVDEWTVNSRLALTYGMAYAWQDYVASGGLLSPRLSATLFPAGQVRVRASVSRHAVAPGSEELIPAVAPGGGLWLPVQRSFSSWSGPDGFQVQRTDHFEMAVERVRDDVVMVFRTFYQRVDDQMGVLFAQPTASRPAASLGHYYVTAVGDVSARGWSVSLSRPILPGVRGFVDYSQTTSKWLGNSAGAGQPLIRGGGRSSSERFYDLTTSLQTDIPWTATRVYVLYRLNNAFASEDASSLNDGLDARFDIQVNQSLPFLAFTAADWEVLLAVRNLFHDTMSERSVFDELLVVRPPTRVVGGVRVRF